MGKPSCLVHDNLDDRRELWHLLHRLPPAWRVSFLEWCCKQVAGRYGPVRPRAKVFGPLLDHSRRDDRADLVTTNEVYLDVYRLGHQYGLDLDAACRRLEAVAKRNRLIPEG